MVVEVEPNGDARMDTTPLEILVFEIGGRRYGLAVADVRELVRAVTVVPLPRAPAIVEGAINLRGRVVPVLDLRGRFQLPAKPLDPSDHLIIAQAGERLVALRVDRALELLRLDAGQLEEVRGIVPGAEYISWIAKLPADLVLIHDLRAFLTRAESAALAEALPQRDAAESAPT
jgi:purine-binding chemotaxis protein CheW